METARALDEKSGGKTYEYSVLRGKEHNYKFYTNRFDSIEEVTKFAIRKYRRLKLNCDFISLYHWEKFDKTKIIKNT